MASETTTSQASAGPSTVPESSIPADEPRASDAPSPTSLSPEEGEIVAPSAKRRPKGRRDADGLATPQASPEALKRLVPQLEALLISLDRPVQPVRLAQSLGLLPPGDDDGTPAPDGPIAKAAIRQIEQVVGVLNEEYVASARSFRIELLAGGYRVMTLPEFAGLLANFHKRQTSSKLSRPAVETLAIIAYKQPLTRAELEAIRGVSCGEVLKTLLEKRLVTIKGRAEELGRPLLYGTTTEFLKHFGLASIKDLPSPTELKLPT